MTPSEGPSSEWFPLPPAVRRSPFRRRVAALVVDLAILWAVGMVFGTALAGLYPPLVWSGQLFGLAIAVAYFGVLGSRVAGGQTIGKRLLGLRVLDAEGNPPALPKALLRAFVLTSPAVLNGLNVPGYWPLLNALLITIVFGVGSADFLVPLINRKKGARGFHDLVTGTRVVDAVGPGVELAPPSPRVLQGFAGWCGLLLLVCLFFAFKAGAAPPTLERATSLAAREQLTGLSMMKNQTQIMGGDSFEAIVITASSTRSPATFPQTAALLVQSACELVPDTANARFVQVTIRYGWNLGIARSFDVQTTRAAPSCGTAAR